MGRRRNPENLDLPPRLRRVGHAFYFEKWGKPRRWQALGSDRDKAMAQWAKLYAEGAGDLATAAPDTFAAVAHRYRLEVLPDKAEKTRAIQSRQLTALVAVFGHMRIADIEPIHVRQWLDARGRSSKAAANRERALLSHLINCARSWGLSSAANPCPGVSKFSEKPRTRYVEDHELRAVFEHADQPLRVALQLAYATGQRPSDILAMKRADVRDGFLHVDQEKTGARLRIVVEGELAELLATLPATGHLVQDRKGRPLTYERLRRRFETARQAAGVDFEFRDIRPKSATDIYDSQGTAAASALLGHASASTTDRYFRQRAGRVVRPVSRKL